MNIAMMKLLRVLLLVFAIGFSTNSNAVISIGNHGCGEWIKSRAEHTSSWYEHWFSGYISGLAAGTGIDILADITNESLFLWVDNYCRANPLDLVGNAAYRLASDAEAKKK